MYRLRFSTCALLLAAATPMSAASGQQVSDTSYRPTLVRPTYALGTGPMVCVDGGHQNVHTLEGGYAAFGRLLRADGWRTQPLLGELTAESLAQCRVLVVANALPPEAPPEQGPRPSPSAFTAVEQRQLRNWVAAGGGLFLIADHMPFAGAVRDLAAAFGVRFTDGFAVAAHRDHADLERALREPTFFKHGDGSLARHPVTAGIDSVQSFIGQAMQVTGRAEPILRFPAGFVNLLPDTAWEFHAGTRREPIAGWSQGALLQSQRGRVVFWGEAAMFTAQLTGSDHFAVGMNSRGAEQNHRLLLNLVRWVANQ